MCDENQMKILIEIMIQSDKMNHYESHDKIKAERGTGKHLRIRVEILIRIGEEIRISSDYVVGR